MAGDKSSSRQNVSRAKWKGILLANGNKAGRQILKPKNGGASLVCKESVGGFDDGASMGRFVNVERMNNFQFQVVNVQPVLDDSSHKRLEDWEGDSAN